jgi:integrase
MPLSTLAVKNAKPKEKQYKLADERGLYLLVTPSGGRLWRLKYRFAGKERLLALGAFPDVSLVGARDAREEARRLLAKGIDPSSAKRAARHHAKRIAGDSFEAIAREWLEKRGARWSKPYADAIQLRLENNVFPKLGARPITEINAGELLELLRKIEARGAGEQARRSHQHISNVMRYAIVTGRATRDVAADVRGALEPAVTKHRPAITEPEAIGGLLAAVDGYSGTFFVKQALLLLAHTFVRPSELRGAKWSELDFDARLWSVPAERTKLRRPHLVPLTDRTLAMFEALRDVRGKSELVFPGYRSPETPLSASGLLGALVILGYTGDTMVAHGFRSMASTRLHEAGFAIDVIEAQLAHAQRGVRGVYNRALYLKERREMLIWWSDYLDGLLRAHAAKAQDPKARAAAAA